MYATGRLTDVFSLRMGAHQLVSPELGALQRTAQAADLQAKPLSTTIFFQYKGISFTFLSSLAQLRGRGSKLPGSGPRHSARPFYDYGRWIQKQFSSNDRYQIHVTANDSKRNSFAKLFNKWLENL